MPQSQAFTPGSTRPASGRSGVDTWLDTHDIGELAEHIYDFHHNSFEERWLDEVRGRQEEEKETQAAWQALARSRERVTCFFLDYYKDAGYSAPTSLAARQETQEWCWSGFFADKSAFQAKTGFDSDDWRDLVSLDEMNDADGEFWRDGMGAGVLKWAIVMVVMYASVLETTDVQNTGCDTSLPAAKALIDSWRKQEFGCIGLFVNEDAQVTGTYAANLQACGLPSGVVQVTGGAQGDAEWGTSGIRISPTFTAQLGVFADAWMNAAHQLYWARKEGGATKAAGAVELDVQIFRAGAYALSAVAELAGALLHEVMHQATGWTLWFEDTFHCAFQCCHTVARAKWWACVVSRNGLVGGVFSSAADGLPVGGASQPLVGKATVSEICDDIGKLSASVALVLNSPGIPAGNSAWSATVTLPSGCD